MVTCRASLFVVEEDGDPVRLSEVNCDHGESGSSWKDQVDRDAVSLCSRDGGRDDLFGVLFASG